MAKNALITFGNEESYGLSFVGGELLEHGQEIRFFDESTGIWPELRKWKPDFVMFSPLTTFYPKALRFAGLVKELIPKARTVFGGHHAFARPDIADSSAIDTVVVGPVRGSIDKILKGEKIIKTQLTYPYDLPKPARAEYYRDIPRAGKRYRKFLLSILGCPWNCSYCSSSNGYIRKAFAPKAHKDYFLSHRPLSDVLKEAKLIAGYNTYEIDWVDDDIFAGNEDWLFDLTWHWQNCVNLPMYISTTSVSALKVSDRLLMAMRKFVNVIGMGIQAIRPESLKLFNRQWDNEAKMKAAYDRLVSFGYRVNLQAIVGLPVDDPLEDAIETVMAIQRIGPGSICSVYPLMIYPGTKMEEYCKNMPKNLLCNGDTNSATCALDFSPETRRQLRNLCKLATFIVKYNLDERLVRALLRIDFDEKTSKELSMLRYRECVIDRLGDKGERIFDDILSSMRLRF